MSWFWPDKVREDAGVVARAGRVLHWISIVIAVAICALYWAIAFESGIDWGLQTGFGATAVVVALLGRGARYILSGE